MISPVIPGNTVNSAKKQRLHCNKFR